MLPESIEDEELDDTEEEKETKEDKGKIKPGPGRKSMEMATYWKDCIGQYEEDRSKFITIGNSIIKRYRDQRNRVEEEGQRRMNLLWANTRIMLPALYSKTPVPIIDRKFLDHDPIGRLSSMIAERSVRNEIVDNGYHKSVKAAVLDYLLPGQGQVWVRYDSETSASVSIPSGASSNMEDELERIENPEGKTKKHTKKEQQLEDTGEQLLRESVSIDYIDWKDFYMLPAKARTWAEVQAVAKRVLISKTDAKNRFGEEIGEAMHSETTPMSSSNERRSYSDTGVFNDINERSIVIYEIWNKSDRKAYWVSPGYDYLCDVKEDPLEVSGFFPCPEPIFANVTNDSLIPVADYTEWQDQAIQIDELTQRIAMLTKACKVAGTYDGSNTALSRILDEAVENQLIPVDNWVMYAEKGGTAGSISLLPIKEIQEVIRTLQEVRQQAMQDLDVVTGVNDIMRGTTDSRETLGGIRLKNNNTGTRLSDRQADVARFARDTIRIMSEVMCKHFSDDTLIESSGIKYDEELNPKNVKIELVHRLLAETNKQPPAPAPSAPPMPSMAPPIAGAAGPMGAPPLPTAPPGPGMPPMPPPGPGMTPPVHMQPPMPPQLPPPVLKEAKKLGIKPDKLLGMDPEKVINLFVAKTIELKIEKALKLLREDIPRRYRIDIEVDSTIYSDAAQERADAVEFTTAFANFMKFATETSEKLPEAVPMMGRMLQFAVRKFRSGRDLESSIDEFVETMNKKSEKMIANPPPTPEQMKMQIEEKKGNLEIQKMKMQAQAQEENDKRDAAKQQAEDQRTMQMNQMEDQREQRKMQLEEAKQARDHQFEAAQAHQDHQMDTASKAVDLQAKTKEVQLQEHIAMMELKVKERELELKLRELELDEEFAEKEHQRKLKDLEEKAKERKEKASVKNKNGASSGAPKG